jgi:hypothetical protein
VVDFANRLLYPADSMACLFDYTGEIGHVFRMKSAIDSGGKKAS